MILKSVSVLRLRWAKAMAVNIASLPIQQLAKKAGLDREEIANARRGSSADSKADAAVKLASSLNKSRGSITTVEFTQAKEAGLSDAEIVEIITHVGLNFLNNILSNSMQVKN